MVWGHLNYMAEWQKIIQFGFERASLKGALPQMTSTTVTLTKWFKCSSVRMGGQGFLFWVSHMIMEKVHS